MRRSERLDALRAEMADAHLDAVVLTQVHHVAAFLDGAQLFNGTRAEPPGRAAVVVTADGLVVVGNHTEAERIASDELVGFDGVVRASVSWPDWSLEPVVRETLHARGLSSWTAAGFGPGPSAGRELLDGMMYPLTALELERLQRLGRLIASTLEAVTGSLAEGVQEQEVGADLQWALLAAGALPDLVFVAFDERIARYRHCKPGPARLASAALLSITASLGGLYASATRLVSLVPDAELQGQTRAANGIEAAAIEAVVLGRPLEGIFSAIQEAYRAAGEPDGWQQHHLGGPSGFRGRDCKVGPSTSGPPIEPGHPFVFNPVLGAGKSEDTFVLDPVGGELQCITRTPVWPQNSVVAPGGLRFDRPGVLVITP